MDRQKQLTQDMIDVVAYNLDRMKVELCQESGYNQALEGQSYSYDAPLEKMPEVALRLSKMSGGHDKFLEMIETWWDMMLPRYMWQEFDTYRVGVTKLSQSTIHTITRRDLTQEDFIENIDVVVLERVNAYIQLYRSTFADGSDIAKLDRKIWFRKIKRTLPEGFLQKRKVRLNYKALKNIITQRRNHKLDEWNWFITLVKEQIAHPELLPFEEAAKNG